MIRINLEAVLHSKILFRCGLNLKNSIFQCLHWDMKTNMQLVFKNIKMSFITEGKIVYLWNTFLLLKSCIKARYSGFTFGTEKYTVIALQNSLNNV